MSVEAVLGGRRRIDRVLDPRFVADVGALGLDELRSRRSEAEAEERSISYLRCMLQGRLDILRAELEGRERGGEHDMGDLVAGLPVILSDPAAGSFTAVARMHRPGLSNHHHHHHHRRRRLDRLAADETVARLPDLDTEELRQAIEALARAEEAVSANRRAVLQVVDLLRGELARRYRKGTASVAQVLE